MTDIAISIGLDSSPAKVGRDQIVRWNDDIAASYDKVLAASKAAGGQAAGAGLQPLREQKAAVDDLSRAYDIYAANRMRDMERIASAQAAQNARQMSPQLLLGTQTSGASARDSASVFKEAFKEQERLESAHQRATAAIMTGEQQRAQAAQKASAEQARAVSNLTATYAPHVAELQRLARDESRLNDLRRSGAIDSNTYGQALTSLRAKQAQVTNETERMAAGAKLQAHQMTNLTYQIQDAAVQLAGGQNPFLVLMQQGPQATGAVGGLSEALSLLKSPTAIAAAGLLAVGGAIAAVAVKASQLANYGREADVVLRAMGDRADFTAARLRAMQQTMRAGGASNDDAQSAALYVSRIADFDAQTASRVSAMSLNFAAGNQVDLATSVKALSEALNKGYAGVKELQEQFNLFTAEEMRNIRTMAEHGDKAGVLNAALTKLEGRFKGLANDALSPTDRAMHQLSLGIDSLITKVANAGPVVGFFSNLGAQLERLSLQGDSGGLAQFYERRIKELEILAKAVPNSGLDGNAFQRQLDDYRRYLAALRGEQGPSLSLPMPPPSSAQSAGDTGAAGKPAQAAPSDGLKAETQDLIDAYEKERRALFLVGEARDLVIAKARAEAEIRDKNLSGDDAAAVMALRLREVKDKYAASAQASSRAIDAEVASQQRLNAVIGQGYEAKRAAQIENAVAAERAKSGGLSPSREVELRRELARKEEARRVGEEFTDLQSLQDSAKYENMLADARLRGAEALRLTNVEIETQKRLEKYGGSESDIRKAVNDNSLAQQRSELASKASGLSATLQSKQELQDLDLVIAKMRELGATADEIAQVYQNAEIRKLEATQDWADGARASLMRYSQNASNYGAMAGNVVSSGMRSMENALVSFSSKTMTAAQAFKSMAASIIQDLIRMQVQAQITGPLSKALSAGIGGWFQSGPEQLASANSSIASSPGMSEAFAGAFASGTDYAPGGLSLVGEQGPELMQLPGGSRIYPADETSAILSPKAANANERTGGNVVQITNYVEAGASMADVEAAVASGIQQAAPHLISAAVQQSVPASLSAVQSAANRGGSFAQAVGRR